MDYGEFAKLPDRVKIEARLSWLEWKMLDMLWLLISLTSLLVGAIAAWLTEETIGNRSLWLLIPVFVFTSLMVGWLLKRRTFTGAPPRIELIDP
jgi:uncharacterized membrane protein YoaK (UPF0700 family)